MAQMGVRSRTIRGEIQMSGTENDNALGWERKICAAYDAIFRSELEGGA